MSFLDYIPGVAHVKAGVHLICNDQEGAARTMETLHTKTPGVAHMMAGIAKLTGDDELAQKRWEGGNNSLDVLPVVGHAKGLVHYACFDVEGGNKAMVGATSTTLNIADGIPVVGHAKGAIHYACGDVEGGNKAMKAATRTTAVMGAGAGGFLVGGPVGAVAGGVSAGASWDVTNASLSDGKEVNGIAQIINNPTSVDSYFNAGLSLVSDGLVGYSGGKMAEKVVGPSDNVAAASKAVSGNTDLSAAAQQLVDDLDAGKISWTEYSQKWDAIKPKGGFVDNVPVKVNAEQLNMYYANGNIPELQYQQAMDEMARGGGKQVTVLLNDSSTSSSTNGNQQQPNRSTNSASNNESKKRYKASNGGQQQPPQQPNRNNRPENTALEVHELLDRLEKILRVIRQRIRQAEETGEWSPEEARFQRETLHEIYNIVNGLIAEGYSFKIENGSLVIYSRDGSQVAVIEKQVAIYLDVQHQLSDQSFALNSQSPCPTVLLARFNEESSLVLSRDEDDIHHNVTNATYGIRCRLCPARDPFEVCTRNVNYVGLSTPGKNRDRSVHKRVCKDRKGYVDRAIKHFKKELKNMDRPMIRHAVEHFLEEDLPEGIKQEDVFRLVMEVILLPIGPIENKDDLRSWELFWQFFFACREDFEGWSHH